MLNSVITINATVHGAKAIHGYTIGLPPLPAVWGLTHAMELKLSDKLNDTLNISAFSVAYRDFSMLGRCRLSLNAFRDKKDLQKGSINAPIIENHRCNFSVSLVLFIKHSESTCTEDIKHGIKSIFDGSRFASGLFEIKNITSSNTYDQAISSIPKTSFFITELNEANITRVDDKGELLNCDFSIMSGKEKLSLLEELTAYRTRYGMRTETTDITWYLPLINGYVGITPAKVKSFSRQGYAHMYAEPTIGIYVARNAQTISNLVDKVGLDSLGIIFRHQTTDNSFFISSTFI